MGFLHFLGDQASEFAAVLLRQTTRLFAAGHGDSFHWVCRFEGLQGNEKGEAGASAESKKVKPRVSVRSACGQRQVSLCGTCGARCLPAFSDNPKA